MVIMSDNPEASFSSFGKYDLEDELELILPNTLIKFHRISENAFSYYRKNSEGKVVEKIIPVKSQDVKIELAPIDPLIILQEELIMSYYNLIRKFILVKILQQVYLLTVL